MKKPTIFALLILIIGILLIAGIIVFKPWLEGKLQRSTSDAARTSHTIRIAGDNYAGYFFTTSPEMKKAAARSGIQIQWTNDGGAYADRLENFADKKYDMIVLPINSYLEHGQNHNWPGVIITAISESKGADAVVAFSDRVSSARINDLNDPTLRIVYTSDSPSEFLLELIIADFGLDRLQADNSWRVEVGSSEEVLKRAKKGDGDVFVLWEPDVSKALDIKGMVPVWGSDKFSGYIIDVFVVHRDYLKKNPEVVENFFKTYFRVMSLYTNNRAKMIEDMKKSLDLKEKDVEKMLTRVDWYDLSENCDKMFGLPSKTGIPTDEGVINSIIACTDVKLNIGAWKDDPLRGNPYLITNRSIMERLSLTRIASPLASAGAQQINFEPLDENAWKKLNEVGTMRIQPVTFQMSNNRLSEEGKQIVDKISSMLTINYPQYRVIVRGHTGPGNEEENKKLSLARAEAVKQYLIAVGGLDPDRLRAEGLGSSSPPQKKPGESRREFRYRLPRVEIVLAQENVL